MDSRDALGTQHSGHEADETDGLSISASARLLGVSPITVRRAIDRGELPATRRSSVYRIARADLKRYSARRLISSPETPSRSDPGGTELRTFPRWDAPVDMAFPAHRTALIGRDHELSTLRALLLRSDVPLVTLIGPGGIGKTRLALQVAAGLGEAFPDGIIYVPLAPISEATLVASAIARAMGVPDSNDVPLADRLIAALRTRTTLLVLDNFEHVLDAGSLVATLLGNCRSLTALVTSRARLRISGEHSFGVPPLTLPVADEHASPANLLASDAVRLFVARATAASNVFVLTSENAPAVASICRRLDGLPLAIELVAPHIGMLSPHGILARLDRRLTLLTGGPRDAPVRLQTMRDAIGWSYDLLTEDEQVLFRRLGAFAGGWTLDAAEAVDRVGSHSSRDTFVVLSALVEHSLVRRQNSPGDGTPRFGMLETIREFALDRLDEAGERTLVQDAHAACYVAFAEQNYAYRVEPGERLDDRLARVELEHPNLRAALSRLAEAGEPESVLQLAGALVPLWSLRGHLREGQWWLEWALTHTAENPTALRSRGLTGLAHVVLWSQGHQHRAGTLAQAGLEIAERIGNVELAARAIHVQGLIAEFACDWHQARALMARAIELWSGLGQRAEIAMGLGGSAVVAYGLGDAARAVRYAEESLVMARELGHAFGTAMMLNILGRLARERGDDRHALTAYQEALSFWSAIGDRESIVQAITGLGDLASVHGQGEAAATLVGASDALAEESGHFILERFMQFAGGNNDRAAARARADLGDERFNSLRSIGQQMSLDDAIAVASAVIVPPDMTGGVLTRRECDVLRLIAAGHTDQGIADALFLSRRTVNSHVAHVLAKLNVSTRYEAVTRGHELGLLLGGDAPTGYT